MFFFSIQMTKQTSISIIAYVNYKIIDPMLRLSWFCMSQLEFGWVEDRSCAVKLNYKRVVFVQPRHQRAFKFESQFGGVILNALLGRKANFRLRSGYLKTLVILNFFQIVTCGKKPTPSFQAITKVNSPVQKHQHKQSVLLLHWQPRRIWPRFNLIWTVISDF